MSSMLSGALAASSAASLGAAAMAAAGTRPERVRQSPSLSPSSSAFDQGLLTVSNNSVQSTDTSEFARQ